MVEAVSFSETSVSIFQMTMFFWNVTSCRFVGHNPEEQYSRLQRCENLKFQNIYQTTRRNIPVSRGRRMRFHVQT
jgi:hypothetical protein